MLLVTLMTLCLFSYVYVAMTLYRGCLLVRHLVVLLLMYVILCLTLVSFFLFPWIVHYNKSSLTTMHLCSVSSGPAPSEGYIF